MLYVPVDIAIIPATGHAVVDNWWLCDIDKGLMWWTTAFNMTDVTPQCNPDRAVIDYRIKSANYTNVVAMFVPVVFNAHAVKELRSQRDQKLMFDALSKDWTT